MDTRTGKIFNEEQAAQLKAFMRGGPRPSFVRETSDLRGMQEGDLRPMNIQPTARQQERGSVGRNDPCPCGSGVKFKRCCLQPDSVGAVPGSGR